MVSLTTKESSSIEAALLPPSTKRVLLVAEQDGSENVEVGLEGFHLTIISVQNALRFTRINQEDQAVDVILVSSELGDYTNKYLSDLKAFASKKSIPFILYSKKFSKLSKSVAMEYGFDDYYSGNLAQGLLRKAEFIRKLKVYKSLRGDQPYAINHHVEQPKVKMWALKRTFDVVVSGVALLLLSPLMLLIAIIIKLESKGSVFYISKRAGSGYKIFDFYKFRSMRQGADAELKKLSSRNQYGVGLFFKIKDDPRITRFGRFLRQTSLDELPQLINVLKGDMSLVGNRPLPLYEAEKLTRDQIAWRFLAPAGITGLWQVTKRGKDNMSEEERIQLDMEYAMNNSFLYDIKILLNTIPALIQKERV
jgi:lipopolysaccharide/colanic/teichoic acid biosynthesis glycosyltransferase